MLSLAKLKQQVKIDWANFCSKINLIWNVRIVILFIFLLLIFPYFLFLWFLLVCYKYIFVYFFLILDIYFFDFLFEWKIIGNIYKRIKLCIFFFFYNPIFIYLPFCYKFIISNLTVLNFSKFVKAILRFLKWVIAFLFSPVIKLINLLIEYDFSFLLFWASFSDRYARNRDRNYYRRRDRYLENFNAKQKKRKLNVINRIKRRTVIRIKICDIKIWYFTKLSIFTNYWYKFWDKFRFIYIFILRIYLRCKYIWLFRFAYYGVYKRLMIFKSKLFWDNILINLNYCYNFFLNFCYFKPKLVLLYLKFSWITFKLFFLNGYEFIKKWGYIVFSCLRSIFKF